MTAVASLTHVRVVVDHAHTVHPIAKISTDFIDLSFYPIKSSSSVKIIVCCTFYSQPFNEIFIFSGKSNCCNDTFAIYIAAIKEDLTRRQIIF